MAERPTLHLTNWSSPRLHGPGRKLTIMAKPRSWEHGDGVVSILVPAVLDLMLVKRGLIDVAEYRRRYDEVVRLRCETGLGDATAEATVSAQLAPGVLDSSAGHVADGDTLLCACAREAAGRGECHRVWSARMLADAGWRVVLDGVEMATIDQLYDDVGTFGVCP